MNIYLNNAPNHRLQVGDKVIDNSFTPSAHTRCVFEIVHGLVYIRYESEELIYQYSILNYEIIRRLTVDMRGLNQLQKLVLYGVDST